MISYRHKCMLQMFVICFCLLVCLLMRLIATIALAVGRRETAIFGLGLRSSNLTQNNCEYLGQTSKAGGLCGISHSPGFLTPSFPQFSDHDAVWIHPARGPKGLRRLGGQHLASFRSSLQGVLRQTGVEFCLQVKGLNKDLQLWI